MNPIYGIFHYSTDLEKATPILQELDAAALSYKEFVYSTIRSIAIVSPSMWLKEAAMSSELFPHATYHQVANPIGFEVYDKEIQTRSETKNTALVIAHDLDVPRKGMHILEDALSKIDFTLELITLGSGKLSTNNEAVHIKALGAKRSPDEIMACYDQVDVLILPSIEDNLPNTMLEALSVGTPVVAFNTGGMKETIQAGRNGVLVDEISGEALAMTLNKFFKEKHLYDRNAIREDAKLHFEAKSQAAKYLEVYKTLTP